MKNILTYVLLLTAVLNTSVLKSQYVLIVNYHKGLQSEQDVFSFNTDKQVTDKINTIQSSVYSESYLNADFTKTTKNDSVFFDIKYNQKYKWKSLNLNNLDSLNFIDQNFYYNKNINSENIELFFNELLRKFENNGYPFVILNFDNIITDSNLLSADLKAVNLKKIIIDTIELRGNLNISNNYIQKIIDIEQGDLYNESKVKKISDKLKTIEFASEIESPKVEFRGNKAKIFISLKEKKTNTFDALLGFKSSNENNNTLSFSGYLKLNLSNTFGKGSNINIDWNKLIANNQKINTGFSYPYILNSDFAINYNFELYKRDTLFLNFRQKPGIRLLLSNKHYFEIYSDLYRSQIISKEVKNQLDFNINAFGLKYSIKRLDNIYNPRKGFIINISADAGKKNIIKNPLLDENIYDTIKLSSNTFNSSLKAAVFIPVLKRSGFLIANNSKYKLSEGLLQNELFTVGGFNTLRGFEEDEFFADFYSIFTTEYRFLIASESYLAAFSEYALIQNKLNNSFNDLISFGTGMSFRTDTGLFSIVFALGGTDFSSIQFRNTKVHLGYKVIF